MKETIKSVCYSAHLDPLHLQDQLITKLYQIFFDSVVVCLSVYVENIIRDNRCSHQLQTRQREIGLQVTKYVKKIIGKKFLMASGNAMT